MATMYLLVPTLCVGMPPETRRVIPPQTLNSFQRTDAERPGRHSHAERGNDQQTTGYPSAVSA